LSKLVADLQIVVLSFLLGFQVKSCQSPQVLLTHGLVDGGASSDSLAVVVGGVRPPISFRFHVAKNHVFDRGREAGYLRIVSNSADLH